MGVLLSVTVSSIVLTIAIVVVAVACVVFVMLVGFGFWYVRQGISKAEERIEGIMSSLNGIRDSTHTISDKVVVLATNQETQARLHMEILQKLHQHKRKINTLILEHQETKKYLSVLVNEASDLRYKTGNGFGSLRIPDKYLENPELL